jgi:dTDP-glucose 4,6-dehydratase
VDDEVEGFVRLLASDEHDPVNIGNPTEMTVLDMAKMVIRLTGSTSDIEYLPRPVDDPTIRRPDISRARAILGWEPQVGVEDGLKRTIEWFKEQKG